MKLNYKRTMLVGIAFMTISAFWQLYDFVIPLILKNNFAMNDAFAGFIMSLDNILALFMLPLFGMLSDKTSSRLGKRMPFIVLGTIAAVSAMMLIPYAASKNLLVVFMVALGLVLLFMSVYRSPAIALMPDITPKPLRSKGNAVINLMGAVGSILILALIKLLNSKNESGNYFPIFAITGAFMLVGLILLLITVKEPSWANKMRQDSAIMGIGEENQKNKDGSLTVTKLPSDVKRSLVLILLSISLWFMGYNAVTTAFSKYATIQLHMTQGNAAIILMIAQIAAIIAFIPMGLLSSKIGRKKSILCGVVVLALVFGSAFLYSAFSPLMYVSFAFAGIAWAAINVNSLPMVLEMSSGGTIGKYTGYYYTFSMAAQVVTPIASGALLQYVGYYTLFPYAALFVALAFITMLFVKHGDSKPVPPASQIEAYGTQD